LHYEMYYMQVGMSRSRVARPPAAPAPAGALGVKTVDRQGSDAILRPLNSRLIFLNPTNRGAPSAGAFPMFAVVRTGGKQYKVSPNDVIVVERLAGDAGSTVSLDDVLMVSDGAKTTVGTPTVSGAKVAAEVVDQARGDKIVVLKFRQRTRSFRRTKGHRQEITVLRVTEISAPGMTTARAEAKAARPKKAEAAEGDAEAAPTKATAPKSKRGAGKAQGSKKAQATKKAPAAKKAAAPKAKKKAPAKKAGKSKTKSKKDS
jgi:large subunit ribosomal protein L21